MVLSRGGDASREIFVNIKRHTSVFYFFVFARIAKTYKFFSFENPENRDLFRAILYLFGYGGMTSTQRFRKGKVSR